MQPVRVCSCLLLVPRKTTGCKGAARRRGKTYIARNIATVIKKLPDCKFIQRNCAMFAGDEGIAKSDLFGHSRGGFSGATTEKVGALKLADGGVLFLDEIGDLPLSVQAMLLTALEDAAGKGFPRLGDNQLVQSNFQLICGTNHDLWEDVKNKRFRQDLLERINLWHFEIPGLKDRREDVISYATGSAITLADVDREIARNRQLRHAPEAQEP